MKTQEQKPTHTPGPWKVAPPNDDHNWLNVRTDEEDGWYIASVTPMAGGGLCQVDANARLIAAAPELLAAARAADVLFRGLEERGALKTDGRAEWARVRAAIAKAEAGS